MPQTDLEQLKNQIRLFCEERDWRQYHNPKDLAIALSVEVSELMELFLWKSSREMEELLRDRRDEVESEIADIATYLLNLVDTLDIDLVHAIEKKLNENRLKYPVDKVKGKNLKYNQFEN